MVKTDVILTHSVEGLGAESDRVTVANGYARNYLLPQRLAVPVNRANQRQIDALKKRREERVGRELNTARELADGLKRLVLTLTVKTGETGRMYGSVTQANILDQLREQFEISLEKKCVQLEEPIRDVGEHEVKLKLHAEVKASLKVRVESSTPLPEPEAVKPAQAKA